MNAGLFRQAEGGRHLLHLGVGHAVGFETHVAGRDVDLRGFVEHVHLVEGVQDIGIDGQDAVLFPHHHVVVVVDGLDGGLRQLVGRRQHVGHHAQPAGAEGLGFGNHGPEHPGGGVFFQPARAVGKCHQLNRMGVEASAVGRAFCQQVIVYGQVGGEFRSGGYGLVGHDLIVRAAGQDADWMIACHPYSYPFIKAILPNKKLIYEAQDVEYLIKKEMYHKNSTVDSALQKLFETEKECCQNSLLIMTCSEADRLKLAELYDLDPSRIIVVPNGVDTDEIEYVSVPDRLANKAKNGLSSETLGIFMGGYHEPNLEAANAIIQMADRIRKAKIFLLGSQCQYFMNRQLPDNVALMGFLSDEQKRRVFSLVDFALNPMMSGSGTNLKMFDYMAAGIPVITTEFGSRGIDNKALFITAENSSLPETINTFDLHSCSEMVSAAREHMETFFDWAKIAEGLMKKMREKE